VLELGLPTVVALNMIDVARDKGLTIDIAKLRERLELPVIELQANRKRGVAELKQALHAAAESNPVLRKSPFPEAFQQEVRQLAALERKEGEPVLPRYLIERLLLDTGGYLEQARLPGVNDTILAEVKAARERLRKAGAAVPAVEAVSRYKWVSEVLDGAIARPKLRRETLSDRVDKLLTHWFFGTFAFALLMIVMFQAVFYVAEPASAVIDWLNGNLASLVEASIAEGALRSLLVNGVIEGVGGVLVFLPQIFTLFLFIAILEDCGYMARAAYLMDKLMSRVGLSGKSFIPMLSSFACAIPGIMAARVIENRRDRLTTILVAPLMTCSARLPVYALLIGAFIPNLRFLPLPLGNPENLPEPLATWSRGMIGLQGITLFAMYLLGIVAAVCVALVLKRTILRGATPPFVMELPSYKLPGLGIVLHRMFERGWAFVRRAGTLIFAVTVLVWAAAYYPRDKSALDPSLFQRQEQIEAEIAALEMQKLLPGDEHVPSLRQKLAELDDELSQVENDISGAYLEHSLLGRAGHLIEPLVRPLGWDWRIGCAAIASFPAREVVVATLGVIYHMGEVEDEDVPTLGQTLRNATWEDGVTPVFNTPVALSIMVFFAFCAQCASTLAVIRRETNSWRWPIFSFVYMTALAYVGALVTYQVGMLFVDRG
jgi:ferrous iron transport protein B